MEKQYCVYVHTNKVNGKKYVGITSQKAIRRWRSGKGYKFNPHFLSAIELYGWDGFEHEIVLSGLTREQACIWECALIAQYDTANPQKGYNVALGGDGTFSVSNATRRKKSIQTAEYYAEHPEARKRRWHGVEQYDLNGEWIHSYNSVLEATQNTGIDRTSIIGCCKHKGHSAGGYQWRYSEEKIEQINRYDKWQRHAVAQYDTNGNLLNTYSSVADAEKALGLKHPSKISYACRGERKTVSGYIWRYSNELQDKAI